MIPKQIWNLVMNVHFLIYFIPIILFISIPSISYCNLRVYIVMNISNHSLPSQHTLITVVPVDLSY